MDIQVVGLDDIGQINTSIDQISGEVVNLIFVAIDGSGSMSSYVSDMKKCLSEFKNAITNSKEVDEILIARADFASFINVGGYKKVVDFDIDYDADGNTLLYDVITEGFQKLLQYIDYLKNQGVRVKIVFSVFSDGEDNGSRKSLNDAKHCVEELSRKEITTAFISFGQGAMNIAKSLSFKNILNVSSSASELRKAFDVLSKSVISASKSVVKPADGDFFKM
jgi:hypothetical protein